MSGRLVRSARAKVNLWLRVLRRRDDGFHEIETRMVEIGLADELVLERTDEPRVNLVCDEPGVPADESNLVVKALRLLEEETGESLGLWVNLRKRIPHGAGLGGGSSDAAAALAGANELLGGIVRPERLRELAGRIGSDVAFFLDGGACDCRGRGEIVEPVEFPQRLRLLLVKPAFSVETPWAYRQWRDSRELEGLWYERQRLPWGTLVNDLERPVFAKHLVLGVLKNWLRKRSGVEGALMSGSGSTVFAVLQPDADGEQLARDVRSEFGEPTRTWVTETVSG